MIKDPFKRHNALHLKLRDTIRAAREEEKAYREAWGIPWVEEEFRVALAGAIWEDIPDEDIEHFKETLDMFCDDDTAFATRPRVS